MEIDIAGQGTVKLKELSVRTFKSSIAGQGNLSATLTGVDNTDVDIAGQGDINFVFHHCKKRQHLHRRYGKYPSLGRH